MAELLLGTISRHGKLTAELALCSQRLLKMRDKVQYIIRDGCEVPSIFRDACRPINHNFFLCWCMKQENIWALMWRRRRIPLQHFDTDSRSSFSFLPNLDSIRTQPHKKMFASLSPSCTHQCPSLTTPQRNVDISSLAKGTTIWATS